MSTLPMQKLTWLGNHIKTLPLSLALSLSLSLLYQSGSGGVLKEENFLSKFETTNFFVFLPPPRLQ